MQSPQNQRKMVEVIGSGAVASAVMGYLYSTLVSECPACMTAHSKTFLAFLVLGMVGASTLLRALVVLSRQALSR